MTCTPFKTSDGMTGILCTGRARRPKGQRMPFPETLDELQSQGYVFRYDGWTWLAEIAENKGPSGSVNYRYMDYNINALLGRGCHFPDWNFSS